MRGNLYLDVTLYQKLWKRATMYQNRFTRRIAIGLYQNIRKYKKLTGHFEQLNNGVEQHIMNLHGRA